MAGACSMEAPRVCSFVVASAASSTSSASSSCVLAACSDRPTTRFYVSRVRSGARVGRAFWSCQQRTRNGRLLGGSGWNVRQSSPVRKAYNNERPALSGANEDHEYDVDPPWIWAFKATYRSVKELLEFLWEQPGQLKYIEFTPFDSMVKMALLTVVVVVLLIIFLASVDSAFSYVLATILRKVP